MESIAAGLLNLYRGMELRRIAVLIALAVLDGMFQALGIASIMPFIAVLADPSLVETSRFFILAKEFLPAVLADNLLWVTGFFALTVLVASNALSMLDYGLALHWFNEYRCRLSERLLEKYLGEELLAFNRRKVSEMSTTILAEVERVVIDTLMAGVGLLADVIVVLAIIGLLLIVDPWATAITSLVLGGGYLIVHLFSVREVQRLGEAHAKAETRMFNGLYQALALFKEAKIVDKGPYFVERFARPAREFVQTTNRYEILTFVPAQLLEILVFSLILVLALFLGTSAEVDFSTIGVIAFYAFAAYRLVPVLKSLLDGLEALRFGASLVDKLVRELELQETKPVTDYSTGGGFSLNDSIILERVLFRYPGAPTALFDEIEAIIPAAGLTCIVGPSGAGKSTLLDLLLGLIEPTAGRCLVDGVPLNAGNVRQWRKGIGYVPQQVQLLDATLAQNIALGETHISQAQVENAARIAQIHDFATEQLASGYETLVGDGGHTMSSGERKRVGIARALYHDPTILLLDEATNELDAATEEAVLDQLLGLPGKTVVFATHKLAIRKRADYVIELPGRFS